MADVQLTVTAKEREYLIDFLEQALKKTRVEEHRTRTQSYREDVVEPKEQVILSVLAKLGQPQHA